MSSSFLFQSLSKCGNLLSVSLFELRRRLSSRPSWDILSIICAVPELARLHLELLGEASFLVLELGFCLLLLEFEPFLLVLEFEPFLPVLELEPFLLVLELEPFLLVLELEPFLLVLELEPFLLVLELCVVEKSEIHIKKFISLSVGARWLRLLTCAVEPARSRAIDLYRKFLLSRSIAW